MLANIDFMFGVFDVLLRMLGAGMAVLVLFLFALHQGASKRTQPQEQGEPLLAQRPLVAEPTPFVMRSTVMQPVKARTAPAPVRSPRRAA